METTSIKAIVNNNKILQESLDNFKNYHIEKNVDIHEVNYGQEKEYCINDIIDLTQNVIDNISFLTTNHDFFINTSSLGERNEIKTFIANLSNYITNRSYNNIFSQLESIKIKIRLYELFINKDRFVDLSSEIERLKDSSSKIFSQINNQVKEQKEILDNNANAIIGHEEEIKNYSDIYKEKASEATTLIEEAKKALHYKNAEGLSAAFSTQLESASNKCMINWWIAGALFFILATLGIGVWIVTGWGLPQELSQNQMIFSLIGRLSMIPFTITAAVFCANQYTKQKNIMEDYAYKTVLAKSIIAFSEELREKNPEKYTEYISTILKEIHQDPLRKRGKGNEDFKLNKDSKGLIEKVIDLLQSAISKQ